MEIYEVFRRSGHKEPFEHAGAVTASDPDMALYLAKECFIRRGEGRHIWVARRSDIHSFTQEEDTDVVADKSYRHPSGYRDIVQKRERAKKRVEELAAS